jgi:hypothetical protein
MLKQSKVDQLASKHGVSTGAVTELAEAIACGRGSLAQFSHPDLGGSGQWMRSGMLMIGDMFNDRLKARVAAPCIDVADALGEDPRLDETHERTTPHWWPSNLGVPSTVGSQNSLRYAFFPSSKRLVIDDNGKISTYDTGDHVIVGVGQQQNHAQSIVFSTLKGTLNLGSLARIE